jgi:hypothetical protein
VANALRTTVNRGFKAIREAGFTLNSPSSPSSGQLQHPSLTLDMDGGAACGILLGILRKTMRVSIATLEEDKLS